MSRKHANTVVGLTMPEFITLIEKHGVTSEQQQRGKRRQETTSPGDPAVRDEHRPQGACPNRFLRGKSGFSPAWIRNTRTVRRHNEDDRTMSRKPRIEPYHEPVGGWGATKATAGIPPLATIRNEDGNSLIVHRVRRVMFRQGRFTNRFSPAHV